MRRSRGSALIMVIWTIAVLSILVINFAVTAKLQSAANVFVRERVHMNHLIEAGQQLAEMIIAKHQSVVDYSEDEDLEELLEDDAWIPEKRQLKQTGSQAVIGPIAVDELHPENGSVTIKIESVGGGEGGGPKININLLVPDKNPHYAEIWENILYWAGVPEDDHDYFVNSWIDWVDEDDVMKGEYGDKKTGGEAEYYEDICKDTGEEVYKPRNGAILDLKELAKVGAFRLHPALLTGGIYNPEDDRKDQFSVSNICDVLDVFGGEKINVNMASKSVLMCLPGIRDKDDPEDTEQAELVAQAIIDWRNGIDMDGNPVDLEEEQEGTIIKDWSKLVEITDQEIQDVAQEYLGYTGGNGDGTLYVLTITANAMGMEHTVKAKMTLMDSKPVYLEWQENP